MLYTMEAIRHRSIHIRDRERQALGPGRHVVRPVGDRMQKVNMQIIAMAVPAQDGITKDNVTVRVDSGVYFRVLRWPGSRTARRSCRYRLSCSGSSRK